MRVAPVEAGCDMGVVREVISPTRTQWNGRRYVPAVVKVIRCHRKNADVTSCLACPERQPQGGD